MAEGTRQFTLDLPVDTSFSIDDFLVSPSNEAAYGLIEAWPDWSDRALIVTGPEGSGKSHLAAIFAARSGATVIESDALSTIDAMAVFSRGPLVVENVGEGPVEEATLFHCLNLMVETGRHMLLTSRHEPTLWPLALADVRSRVRRAPTVAILPPDDALLRMLLVKLFCDRQLVVDTSVINFLALRMERSFRAAQTVVGRIDRQSLALGRRVSRGMVAHLLAEFDLDPQSGS
jgi:chromosomal replication initiation ATPase DnaA